MICCILIAALFGVCFALLNACRSAFGTRVKSGVAWRPGSDVGVNNTAAPFLRARLQSFGYAIEGLSFLIATQPHARIHAVSTLGVALLGMFLGVDRTEALWLGVAIALVWFAEALNTAVEHLCDVVSPEPNASVKRAKDIAAGAVLVVAIFSVFAGTLIFWPYLNSQLPVTKFFHGR